MSCKKLLLTIRENEFLNLKFISLENLRDKQENQYLKL